MKTKCALACFAFQLVAFVAFSQASISGKVENQKGEAVDFVNVTLMSSKDGKQQSLVAYTLTDSNGYYEIKTDRTGDFVLQASSLNHKTQATNITLTKGQSLVKHDFTIEENSEMLSEIVVKATEGISVKSDTVVYNPKVFTDGTEKSLGDMLNKLPGLEVDGKGNVKAHGKNVDKILVNNQDFFEGNTQMAVKNLSADVADKVEVLNSYSDYSLLKGFQTHDQTAINIGVDKNKLSKLSGTATAAGGVENRYLANGNLMRISNKLMLGFFGASNNNGEEVFSIEDYFRLQGGISNVLSTNKSGQHTLNLSREEQSLLVPKNNVYSRVNSLSAINVAYNPTSVVRINSYAIFNLKNEKSEDNNKYTFFLPDNSELSTTNQTHSSIRNSMINGSISAKYQPSETFNANYSVLASGIQMDDNSEALYEVYNKKISATKELNAKSFNTNQNLSLLYKPGKHLLKSNFSFSSSSKPLENNITSDSLLLPLPLLAYNKLFYAQQQNDFKQLNGSAELAFLYKLSAAYFIESSVSYQLAKQNFQSSIYENPGNQHVELNDEELKNNSSLRMNTYSAFLGVVKNTGLIQFKLGGSANKYQFNTELSPNVDDNPLFRINPQTELSFNFKANHVLRFNYAESIVPNSIQAFNTGIVFDDYRSYSQNSTMDSPYKLNRNLNLHYQLVDLFSNTMLNLMASYSQVTFANTLSYYQTGIVAQVQPVQSPTISTLLGRVYLNKGLGFIPWALRLNGGADRYVLYTEIDGIRNQITKRAVNGKLLLLSKYRGIFNVELASGIDFNRSTPFIGSKIKQTIQTHSGKIIFKAKKWIAEAELEYLKNYLADYRAQQLYLLNASVRYLATKKLEFAIDGTNMLNINKQHWVLLSFNGNNVTESHFRQIPGNIMLRVKLTL